MIVAVPTYVLDEINKRVDAAIAEVPDAAPCREEFVSQLVAYVMQHGVIPEFSLQHNAHPTD